MTEYVNKFINVRMRYSTFGKKMWTLLGALFVTCQKSYNETLSHMLHCLNIIFSISNRFVSNQSPRAKSKKFQS